MRLSFEWRKFAKEIDIDGVKYFFHPSIPSQSEFVSEFLRQKNVPIMAMNWREHVFYVLHGFLIDCECDDTVLFEYIKEVDGLTLEEAWAIHMNHPLLDDRLYKSISKAFNETRDKSLEQPSLDVNIDKDEDEVEKKETA